MATFEISGVEEIRRAFAVLPKRVASKVIRQSIRNALKPVLLDAKRRCPVATGRLRDSIVLRASPRRRAGVIALEIRTGPGQFEGETYYGGMVEYGTSKMPARPFMRPAYDANKVTAKAAATRMIREGVDREARALGLTVQGS